MLDSRKRWRPATLLLLLALAGCQHLTPIFGTRRDPGAEASAEIVAEVCRTFAPIRAHRTDTAETLRQVAAHNRAWDALCKPEPAT